MQVDIKTIQDQRQREILNKIPFRGIMIRLTITFTPREANAHFNELTENKCQVELYTQ